MQNNSIIAAFLAASAVALGVEPACSTCNADDIAASQAASATLPSEFAHGLADQGSVRTIDADA
jgi:hypothetical protein